MDCAEGLDIALSAGVDPVRIVMHRSDWTAGPVRRAVNAGVGRFVVSSSKQIALLDHCGQRPQRVLIDVSAGPADAAAADIAARERLNLIGLHCRLDDRDAGTDVVRAMIAQMSWVVRRHGVILARVSLADFETADWGCESGDLRGIAEAINDAVEDGCARHRFPRPALALSPSAAAFSATGSGSWAGRLFRNRSDA